MSLDEPNPYGPPASVPGSSQPARNGISSLRSAVNIGCGLAGLLFMIPALIFSLLDGFSAASFGRFALYALVSLGFAHSVIWALRQEKKETSVPRLIELDLREERAHAHRRTYGH